MVFFRYNIGFPSEYIIKEYIFIEIKVYKTDKEENGKRNKYKKNKNAKKIKLKLKIFFIKDG